MKGKILIIDGDNYLSRIYYTNKVKIAAVNDNTSENNADIDNKIDNFDNINIVETIKKTLKIFTYLDNLIKYNTYDDIFLVFDSKTGKDKNKELLLNMINKYGINSEGYKGQRNKRPVFDLFKQVYQNLSYFRGYKIFVSDTHEADDVIATLSNKYSEEGHDIHILSKDNDMLQLLDEKIMIINGLGQDDIKNPVTLGLIKINFLNKGIKIVDSDDLILYKTIVGDKSDNITGIKGVAVKTLANEITKYGNIKDTNIYKNNIEMINDFFPIIKLNKEINDTELKMLHSSKDNDKYNGYLSKVYNEHEKI